ncbi:MAG: hypothetical protein GY854_07475 [Deltaproteobacteria bacterium]|nr:hypothetical protein [Deltaproteobacteria bacterium]
MSVFVYVYCREVAAFSGICAECESMVEELVELLKEQLRNQIASTKDVATAVNDLLQLGEAADRLADDCLQSAEQQLCAQLDALREQHARKANAHARTSAATPPQSAAAAAAAARRPSDAVPSLPMDVLEFVDTGCSRFLCDLALVVTAYTDMFVAEADKRGPDDASRPLLQFVDKMMAACFDLVEKRFLLERNPSESSLVVRALDRFYRRLQVSMTFSGLVRAPLVDRCRCLGEQQTSSERKLWGFRNGASDQSRRAPGGGFDRFP